MISSVFPQQLLREIFVERNFELPTSTLFLVSKVTFVYPKQKTMVWNLKQEKPANDNVTILHTTSPRAFQRSQKRRKVWRWATDGIGSLIDVAVTSKSFYILNVGGRIITKYTAKWATLALIICLSLSDLVNVNFDVAIYMYVQTYVLIICWTYNNYNHQLE